MPLYRQRPRYYRQGIPDANNVRQQHLPRVHAMAFCSNAMDGHVSLGNGMNHRDDATGGRGNAMKRWRSIALAWKNRNARDDGMNRRGIVAGERANAMNVVCRYSRTISCLSQRRPFATLRIGKYFQQRQCREMFGACMARRAPVGVPRICHWKPLAIMVYHGTSWQHHGHCQDPKQHCHEGPWVSMEANGKPMVCHDCQRKTYGNQWRYHG